MRFILGLLALVMLAAAPASATQSQPGWANSEPIIDARLISDMQTIAPGEPFYIGLHQIMPEGWHTYWRNPGDNGLPVEIEWTGPDGLVIGDIVWPVPIELPLNEDIMDYGYKDEVVLPMPAELPANYSGNSLTLIADATWLVCDVICVPEERTLELTLPVGSASVQHPDNVWYIQAALDAEPQPAPELDASLTLQREGLVLSLSGGVFDDAEADWRELKFYPFDSGVIRHAAEQRVERVDGQVHLVLQPGFQIENGVSASRGGVLSYETPVAGAWERIAVSIEAQPGEGGITLPASAPPAAAAGTSLFALIALAFGGGLILNLMPCVFPILSIKVLKFVETAHHHPNRVRRHGLYFLGGVVLSFVALAAVLVVLREFGLPVGWGFQLQMPIVVAVLALLLFAIGLNLLGVFEVGTSLQGLGGNLAEQPGGRGAFFTGVLAVVVAAPCVGPLAAGALGLALTQPVLIVLLVAAAMGAGLAAPFVLFSFAPALLRFMPKPGAWMETFKQFLSFPMFASVIWLVWVLALQSGPQAVLYLGIAMLALSFAIWAGDRTALVWKGTAVAALIAALFATVTIARLPAVTSTQYVAQDQIEWSPERLASIRSEGRAVFIDVTAAWCVTCQVNKLRVLDSETVQEAFQTYDVAFMRADWTNRNEEIAQMIYSYGQAGVPLYLLYPAGGGQAEVLPTILTKDGVISALAEAAG